MGVEPPRPDEADGAARRYWDAESDAYQAEHGRFLAGEPPLVVDSLRKAERIDYQWAGSAFVWGPEGRTEAELGVLGPVEDLAGCRVLEVGCGAAQCSTWLAAHAVRAVGVDISVNQLRHAARQTPGAGGAGGATAGPHVVAATATALPFADGVFDAAFAAYGSVQFVADLDALLAEVARVLRPGGRWCFSVTHPIRWAFPDEPDETGLAVSGSYFDRAPYVERDATGALAYAEFHRTLGDYVSALGRAGFVVDTLLEPEWPNWNEATWGGWSPLRGRLLPGTLILGARRGRSLPPSRAAHGRG